MQHLVLSVSILRSLREAPQCPQTAGWWLGRALLTVQRVLSGRSPSLREEILNAYHGTIENAEKWNDCDPKKKRQMRAALELELALCEQVRAQSGQWQPIVSDTFLVAWPGLQSLFHVRST